MFKLITFGGLHLDASRPATVSAYRRSVALLVVVAASKARGISREKLTALLWPESDEERGRHALAQTLYRLRQDVGTSAIEGTTSLRLVPEAIWIDCVEFERLLDDGAWEQAAALYAGPFLDGFYLPGAPDFQRWVEEERARLAARHRDALERLAEEAALRGRHDREAEWWRRLAALAPLDPRIATRLMQALANAGDVAAALRHARVYETLLKEELDATPEASFIKARDALSTQASSTRERTADAAIGATLESGADAGDGAESVFETSTRSAPRRPSMPARVSDALHIVIPRRLGIRVAITIAALFAATAAAAYAISRRRAADLPVVAVGYIADFTGDSTSVMTGTLGELLTTGLGRYRALDVVSRARLYQLLPRDAIEPDATALARAAEQAGVSDLVDGALYRRADGTLRLDLRLLDLAKGTVEHAQQIEARDPFTLADSATVGLAESLGIRTSADSEATAGTRSLVALRFYEEGLRAYYQRGDVHAALRLFSSAIEADSGFAMAAYHGFRAAWGMNSSDRRLLMVAMRDTAHATEHDRLLLAATAAHVNEEPSRVEHAERFAVRYPRDPDAQWLLGEALRESGDFAGAVTAYRRLLALEPQTVSYTSARCGACDASSGLAYAYLLADSLGAAERVAREWVRHQPNAPAPWLALSDVLASRGDAAGAREAMRHRLDVDANLQDDPMYAAVLALRSDDLGEADAVIGATLRMGKPALQSDVQWLQIILRRFQGRYREALRIADEALRRDPTNGTMSLIRAQTLFEMGRYDDAARAFALRAREASRFPQPSLAARHTAWALTHEAEAIAASGDTSRLPALADSIEAIGVRSGYGRDQRLHHHVRGLLLQKRGETREAIAEFRRAIFSPSFGYTRTNLHLAESLLEEGEPQEAIAVLRSALHGSYEASNLYVTRTDIHALLARSFAAAGQRDSAVAHLQLVTRSWADADTAVRTRLDALRRELRRTGTS